MPISICEIILELYSLKNRTCFANASIDAFAIPIICCKGITSVHLHGLEMRVLPASTWEIILELCSVTNHTCFANASIDAFAIPIVICYNNNNNITQGDHIKLYGTPVKPTLLGSQMVLGNAGFYPPYYLLYT